MLAIVCDTLPPKALSLIRKCNHESTKTRRYDLFRVFVANVRVPANETHHRLSLVRWCNHFERERERVHLVVPSKLCPRTEAARPRHQALERHVGPAPQRLAV